jgi:hypothetical protein
MLCGLLMWVCQWVSYVIVHVGVEEKVIDCG